MKIQGNRRDFVKSSIAVAGVGLTAEFGFGAVQLPPPGRGTIIDTHTHFYDPTRSQGVPWPPPEDKLLYRRVLPPDYKALPTPLPLTAIVVVEASVWVEDNQWILDLAAREPFIAGFVGNLVAGTDDFKVYLARFGTNPLFRGVRMGAERVRQGLGSSRMMDDLKRLAGRDLSL